MLCDDLGGWDGGWGDGREVKREEIYAYLPPICVLCGRNQHDIVKQLSSN